MQKLARALTLPLLMLVLQPAALRAEEDDRLTLDTAQQALYAEAYQALDAKRYALAYANLSKLADLGHAPSARETLAMQHTDPEIFKATAHQLGRWNSLAVADRRADALAATARVQASR